ncbi:AAA family ATPase [Panacagrimonas sp.]|uniref:AAA family ATPase n=1 Tax=Panacagrimonas sp. TaxID=2480088 RepID=UPI003B526A9E
MDSGYLASYVPRLVRAHLAQDPGCVSRRLTLRHAAVLLTDMQGFTRRVEQATAGGRAELEDLNAQIDRYFCGMIDIVHAHDGEVLAFAGDSMLCAWPAETPEHLPETAVLAGCAGQAIQRALGRNHPTRIGIGVGQLHGALAGGHAGRWELLAGGSALSDAVAAEKCGQAGRLVLSTDAWVALGRPLETVRLDSAHRLLTAALPNLVLPDLQAHRRSAPEVPVQSLEPLVPAAVLHRVRAGQTAWIAEVRPVTVVAVGMSELDLNRPEALEIAHEGVRTFQALLQVYGGTPRLSMDDKGLLVAGDFGLPPAALEHHAERAVRAAQDMLAALRQLGVEGGIGVATARAFCAGFGNDRRRDFGVFGDGTNVATRLMQAARDEVLCDDATAHAARERIAFGPAESVPVKGRDGLVRICRPLGRRQGSYEQDAVLTGRSEEREQIQRRLQALRDGRGGLMLIEGEPGLGKSMLLAHAQRCARELGLRHVAGATDVIDRDTPYLAWRPIFTALLETPADLDGDSLVAHVLARFSAAAGIAEMLPLIGPVLGLSVRDSASTRPLSGTVRAANTYRAMRAILGYFAEQRPLLITLEDAHWLDSASRGFLAWLARNATDILTLIAARPEAGLRAWPRGAEVERIRLREMPAAELLALARQTLGVATLPPALDEVLVQKVGGNPYFCCELLRALLDSGRIGVRDGVCEAGDLASGDMPATVESAVLGRLDRLAPQGQLCLKAASVLGQSFRQDALSTIYPVPSERQHIGRHLASARDGGLVWLDAAAEISWSFRHAIVRDVTYALLTRDQRAPLHAAVAAWYESRFADDLPPLYPLLAHHWDEAGQTEPTLNYLELAGDQSLRAGAFQEARRLFGRALQLQSESAIATSAGRRARWHRGLGMALYFLGELGPSRDHLETVASLLDQPLPKALAATRRRLLGRVLQQTLHRLRPAAVQGRLAARQPEIDLVVECYSKLGQIYYLNGEPAERLLLVTLAGLNLAEQGAPSAALARVLAGSSIMAGVIGLSRPARRYSARAQAVAQSEAGRDAAPQVWHYHAILQAQQGRWQEARRANDHALRLIRELGDQTLEAEACVVRSTFLLCQEDFSGAEQAWSRALRLAQRIGNAQIECWSLLDQAETHLGRAELDAADRVLATALQISTPPQDGYSAIEKQRMTARVRLAQDQPEAAYSACQVVYRMVHAQPPAGYHWADFYATTVEVVLDLIERNDAFSRNRHDALLADAQAGCRRLRGLSRTFGNVRIRAQTLQARLDWIERRSARALRLWQSALVCARSAAMLNEQARVLIELRTHGHAADPALGASLIPGLQAQGAYALLRRLQSQA